MSGVQPTIIDYQGIKVENPTLDKSVTLTMDGPNQGFILDYDKLTLNPKQFTITDNGINFTDTTNNNTTSLARLALVQSLFPAVEVPSNSTTLQINKSLLLNDTASSVTAGLDLDNAGNLTIDPCGNLILKSGNTDRLTISNTGAWTVQGGMSYNNTTNNLTATTFTGAVTQIDVSNNNITGTYYPVFVSGTTGRSPFIDITTGPLTYNPGTGVMNFPGVPTCDISANTTNQLVNFNNFVDSSYIPEIQGQTTTGTPTYLTQIGRYVKINNFCCVQGEIKLSNIGGMVGNLQITLPFQCNGSTSGAFSISIIEYVNTGTTMNEFGAEIVNSTNYITLLYRPTATSSLFSNFTENNITDDFSINFGGTYVTV